MDPYGGFGNYGQPPPIQASAAPPVQQQPPVAAAAAFAMPPAVAAPFVHPPMPAAAVAPPVAPPVAPQGGDDEWKTSGHPLIGREIIRLVEGGPAYSEGKVVGWLSAQESDFLDDNNNPAALFHVKYTAGALANDAEDLELHEVEASIKVPDDDVEDAAAAVMATLPQPTRAEPAPYVPPAPPDNHPGRLIDPRECPDTVETKFIAANPKRAGTACNLRYEAYKDATTVKEFLDKGGWRADLVHDVNKNYAALGGAVPNGVPPPPTKPRKYRPPSTTKRDSDDDADWEKKPEEDDSEDDDFVPSLQEKRAAAAELANGPAFKRRSQGPAVDADVNVAPLLQALGAGVPELLSLPVPVAPAPVAAPAPMVAPMVAPAGGVSLGAAVMPPAAAPLPMAPYAPAPVAAPLAPMHPLGGLPFNPGNPL